MLSVNTLKFPLTAIVIKNGTTNADGTYTIYGQTYASYADYQQYIIDGGEGYGEVDGIIQPITGYEIEKQYTK